MKKHFLSLNLDFLGFIASFLCAIHCALLPFVLTVGILGGLSWMTNSIVETIFIGISILLVSISLYPSYKNKHHSLKALRVAGLGFVLLVFSRFVAHGSSIEVVTVVVGGLLIALSHYINWKLLQQEV